MDVIDTVLWFVVVPVGLALLVGGLAYALSSGEPRPRRYRPGRPYAFAPVWFLAAPDRVRPELAGHDGQTAQRPAIESGIIEDQSGQRVLPGPVGGASDRW